MRASDIHLLNEYNRWANVRILDAAEKLGSSDFLKNMGSSFGSVRDTLAHILAGEWIWLMRWKGISPASVLASENFPDLKSLKEKWREMEMDQTNFLSKISDESLLEVVEYQNLKGETWAYTLWQMIHHLVNHSNYHRGQVTAMLRQLGSEAVPLDFLVFLDKRSGK